MSVKEFDLQLMVEHWAKDYFFRKGSRKERKLMTDDCILLAVDWKRVTFDHGPTEYLPEAPALGTGKPSDLILFNASFTNKTDVKQKYTFRVDRTTRSSCKLEVEQGYTRAKEMNVKLTTPCSVLEASAGFKSEMTLKDIEGQTVEQELTWGTNSEIEVDPRSTAEAKLVVTEEEFDGRFKVKTKISGRVRVVFTNAKDNNSFIKAMEGDIVEAATHALSMKLGDTSGLVVDGRSITCTTTGQCRFRYGIKQMVEVDQQPYEECR